MTARRTGHVLLLTFLGTQVTSGASKTEVLEASVTVLLHAAALKVTVSDLRQAKRQVGLESQSCALRLPIKARTGACPEKPCSYSPQAVGAERG